MAQAAQAQIEQLVSRLQHEGVLDEQFVQLMMLQDDSNPDFVMEVVQLFFEDSGAKIDKIGQMLTLNPVDYHELDQLVHQFKGSSASLGAHTIAQLCIQFRERCQQQDLAACAMLQQQLKVAYADLQTKLGEYMRLETHRKQCLAAGMN